MARLIELNKRRAGLEFKRSVFGEYVEDELRQLGLAITSISEKAKAAKAELLYPKQNKLDELSGKLEAVEPEQMKECLSSKSGEAYELLHQRGEIIKENFKNRLEIAKVLVILPMLKEEERKAVSESIRTGCVAGEIEISSLESDALDNLARFLSRCGIRCSVKEGKLMPADGSELEELRLEMSARNVWVTKEVKEKLDENLGKLKGVNSRIQLMNAERYVKKFTEEEERQFEELQSEYLRLLKEQDELLGDFNAEEKLSVKA
jgi:hypothetical protein